jgi:hypothetical protein
MQAASNLATLDITYDGQRRLVEHHSLAFKRRKVGFGQEYSYACDKTGGLTTGPDLKTFLHPKIQSLANTDQGFEPRMPVELGKAGEFAGKTYFGSGLRTRAFTPRSRARTTRDISSNVLTVAGVFPANVTAPGSAPHKDQYGNQCYGRSGYIAY